MAFKIFFPSLRTEEQPDTVSGAFLIAFGLFQIQTSLHIFSLITATHSPCRREYLEG